MYSNARLRQSSFSFFSSRLISQLRMNCSHHNQSPEILVFRDLWHLILCWYTFIYCIVNNGVVSLFSIKNNPWYGAIPVVLSRPTLSVLSSEVPQDLIFFWSISGAVDETGSGFSRRDVYIPFSDIASALTLLWASSWRGGFSSLLPVVTSTVGICPSRFLIRSLYYTFVNRLGNFRTLKHINIFFKRDRLTIKPLYIGLFRPADRHTVKEDLF